MQHKMFKRSQIFPQFFCQCCNKVVSPGTKLCSRCKNDIEKDNKAWQDTIDDYSDELEEYYVLIDEKKG